MIIESNMFFQYVLIINHSIKIFADETKYTKTKFKAQIKF